MLRTRLSRHAVTTTPAKRGRFIVLPLPSALQPSPCLGRVGLRNSLSGPARCSHMLRPTIPLTAFRRLCLPGSHGFVTSTMAGIAPRLGRPLPGQDFHPLDECTFMAHLKRHSISSSLLRSSNVSRVNRAIVFDSAMSRTVEYIRQKYKPSTLFVIDGKSAIFYSEGLVPLNGYKISNQLT